VSERERERERESGERERERERESMRGILGRETALLPGSQSLVWRLRAGSVHLAERLCFISWQARGQETTVEGWGMGARYVVRRHATTQTVLNKEI
jgi:hypothetical protein